MRQPHILKLLAGLSLILLGLFLSYWNWEKYKQEKRELIGDLETHMQLACSEYRDSLVQHIFKVVVKDSLSLNRDISFPGIVKSETDYGVQTLLIKKREWEGYPDSLENNNTAFQITIDTNKRKRDSSIVVWRTEESDLRYGLSQDTVREAVVKLEFPEDPFEDKLWLKSVPRVYHKIDSIFTEHLEQAGIPSDHALVDGKVVKFPSQIIVPFEYESFGLKQKPLAVFSEFNIYLWKQLSSSLLMSLFLFGVVTLSFFMILRSWLEQMKLTSIKNEFISNMTHELKTPIATVGVAIEALQNYGADSDVVKRKEYLDISKHELNRLKILVDKVLKMSAMEKGDMLSKTEINMKHLVEETLNSMKLHFEKNNVSLNYNVEGDQFDFSGDKIHMTNVIYNLLDNAVKYGSENPSIEVQLSDKNDKINLNIKDNGSGIPSAYHDKVFDRFFRVPSNDVHNVKGHGLGLHYVSKVITQHNGSISLKSKEKEGSTFIIQLPRIK